MTDGVRADGSQIAVGQLASDLQHQILQGGARAQGLVRHGRAIRPIHAIQALPFGALEPVGHRSDPNAELTGDGTQGLAAADGGYHGATPLGLTLCLLMRLPRHGAVDYLDTEPFQANCSPPLFGTYWHETVRDVLALTP